MKKNPAKLLASGKRNEDPRRNHPQGLCTAPSISVRQKGLDTTKKPPPTPNPKPNKTHKKKKKPKNTTKKKRQKKKNRTQQPPQTPPQQTPNPPTKNRQKKRKTDPTGYRKVNLPASSRRPDAEMPRSYQTGADDIKEHKPPQEVTKLPRKIAMEQEGEKYTEALLILSPPPGMIIRTEHGDKSKDPARSIGNVSESSPQKNKTKEISEKEGRRGKA